MQLMIAVLLAVLAAGCATGESFQPFPLRNPDGRVGLVRNLGTTHLNLYIRDEAGRVIEEWYLGPAEEPLSPLAVNRLRALTTVVRTLPPGAYRVDIIPFYYTWGVFSGRQRVDLPKGSAGIFVGRDPYATYDYYTGRHWGWIIEIHGGDRPRDPLLQNLNFSIRCC